MQSVLRVTPVLVLALLFVPCARGQDDSGQGGGAKPRKPEEARGCTGLAVPTAADLEWMDKNGVKFKSVRFNRLGFERINAARRQRELNELPAPHGGLAEFGKEVEPLLPGETKPSLQEQAAGEPPALPLAVDNSALSAFPPIGNQMNLDSCGCFSCTYYQMTHMVALARGIDAKTGGDATHFTPRFTYNLVNGGSNTGTWQYWAYDVMLKHGCPTWAQFPYDGSDYRSWPTDAASWRSAIGYRMDQTGVISDVNTDAGLANVKTMLNNGYVLIFSTYAPWGYDGWVKDYVKNDPNTSNDDSLAGQQICKCIVALDWGHTMTIAGYNDEVWCDINGNGVVDAGEKGALKIANSWGASWGNSGFAWLSYDALRTTTAVTNWTPPSNKTGIYNNEASWITAKASYTPSLLAEFTLNAAQRSDVQVQLGTGDPSSSTPSTTWTPAVLWTYTGGPYAFNGGSTAVDATFVMDFTELQAQTAAPKRYFLYVGDTNTGNATTVSAYQQAAADGSGVARCTNVPQTVDDASTWLFIAAPTVSAVAPASGPTLGGTPVTLMGTGFVSGAAVDFGGRLATGVNVDTSTRITCTTSSHAMGTVRVMVTNTDTQSGFMDSAYQYLNVAPVVQSDPWATPAMVVLPATSTLRVVASDADSGPSALRYTWEIVTGPGFVNFSPNGTASASTTSASFSAAGTYTIRVQVYDGAVTVVSNTVTVIAENSALAATLKGDMNGDGKPDILLQNYAAGTLTVWPMNGSGGFAAELPITSAGTAVALGTDSGGWTLAGCGDFNNDGQQDLVFQNIANGQIQIWLMDRLAVTTILPLRDPNGNVMNLGANSGGWQVAAVDDFNGDGRPEVLLQNYASGALTIWTLGGASYTGSLSLQDSSGHAMSLGTDSGGWRAVGSGNFNSDGKADILFHNIASGTFCVWFLNRTTFTGSSWITNGGSPMNLGANSGAWTVGACADYTSDGKCDILLENTASGATTLWALNGTAYAGSITIRMCVGAPLTLGTNSGGWTVGGCGDINGDGKAEIFWQHTASGALSAWTTSGYTYTGSLSVTDSGGHAMGLGANSAGWRVVGFADFNRDGKPDLLMQNDAGGQVCVWYLNGAKFSSGAWIAASNGQALSLGTNSGGWRVVGAADYNGDGKPDLLLQNDAQGILNIWWLNGTVFTGGSYITDSGNNIVSLGTNSSGWRAAGCGDFNLDGKADIVMQQDALGLITVWFLNGSRFVSSGILKDASGNTMNLGADSAGWRVRGSGDINGDGKREILWQHQATGYKSMWTLNGLTYTGGGMILDPHGAPVGPLVHGNSLQGPR